MSKIELFENERASGYNQFVEAWIPNYRYFINCLPEILRDTIQKDLLVVGCGTGNEIERFVEASAHWEITGVDPSPEMITQAKEKFKTYDNVKLIEGLVNDLNSEKKFSAATLLLVLHFMEDNGDKLRLLQSIADRLEPESPFIILDITGNNNEIRRNLNILRCLLPLDVDETQVNKRLNRIIHELFAVSEQRLSALLEEAGFEAPIRFFQSSIYMGWITKKKQHA